MLRSLITAVGLLLASGAAVADGGAAALVPDALEPGTMANRKLQNDAMVGTMSALGLRGCDQPRGLDAFVTRRAEGEPGARGWQEVWVVRCDNGRYPIRIDFREDGAGGAQWSIRDERDAASAPPAAGR